ncbi:hypothetical protein EJ08DRAFT_653546 [Tothia fuscella]|uniref:F-box domain-containing protein n=1 Tax=Tothia fuscella TaxID=1048955 RepID=A0A9P4TU33_9PEZI|nr:hypothetical protein EJ08DRAFT_653546 [Tothia fuscella]
MAFRPTNRGLRTSIQMSLDSWAYRSTAEFPVDLMIITKSAAECDTILENQPDSVLLSLPLEIIAVIGEILTPVDAVCFTLSCKRAACAVGIKSWSQLKRTNSAPENRWALLQRLRRDLPDYHLCYSLKKLRKLRINEDTQERISPPCSRRHQHKAPANGLRYLKPTLCDVQLLVDRQTYGDPYGFPAEDYTFSTQWRSRYEKASVSLEEYLRNYLVKSTIALWRTDIDLQLCGDYLLLHSVERFLCPRKPAHSAPCSDAPWFPRPSEMCQHISFQWNGNPDVTMASRNLDLLVHNPNFTSWQSCFYQCQQCPTIFRFAAFALVDSRHVEIVVQLAQNLGMCTTTFTLGVGKQYPLYYCSSKNEQAMRNEAWYDPWLQRQIIANCKETAQDISSGVYELVCSRLAENEEDACVQLPRRRSIVRSTYDKAVSIFQKRKS